MGKFLKEYLKDFVDDFLWFLINPTYKNLKNVLRYFSISSYKRRKIESIYQLDKDVRETHADDF